MITFDYDDDADILRVSAVKTYSKSMGDIQGMEVYPGIWVVYVGDEKNYLIIEILKAKKRDWKDVNEFLEENYNLIIKKNTNGEFFCIDNSIKK